MRQILAIITLLAAAACSKSAGTSSATPSTACSGTRVLTVQNGGDEAVNVYALNGRTSTEIGTVPPGRKEITVPTHVRATSFYAVAISRLAIGGSVISAPVETRVTFVEECRPR